MGRQIKRVPLDFNWPLNKAWKGFINPHPGPKDCPECKGEGLNAATREIAELFYDHDGYGVRWQYAHGVDPQGKPASRPPWLILGDCRRWCSDITQDEVEALVSRGRLMDFTHEWTPGKGWQRRPDFVMPTPAQVNEWNERGGLLGHDCINRWILIETRARRLGVYGKCEACRGRGHLKQPRKAKKRYTTWKDFEPPTGPGYQLWETVSEGSPVSPVFATEDDFLLWLVEQKNYSVEAAANFIRSGWVPSMVMSGGVLLRDIESARLQA